MLGELPRWAIVGCLAVIVAAIAGGYGLAWVARVLVAHESVPRLHSAVDWQDRTLIVQSFGGYGVVGAAVLVRGRQLPAAPLAKLRWLLAAFAIASVFVIAVQWCRLVAMRGDTVPEGLQTMNLLIELALIGASLAFWRLVVTYRARDRKLRSARGAQGLALRVIGAIRAATADARDGSCSRRRGPHDAHDPARRRRGGGPRGDARANSRWRARKRARDFEVARGETRSALRDSPAARAREPHAREGRFTRAPLLRPDPIAWNASRSRCAECGAPHPPARVQTPTRPAMPSTRCSAAIPVPRAPARTFTPRSWASTDISSTDGAGSGAEEGAVTVDFGCVLSGRDGRSPQSNQCVP